MINTDIPVLTRNTLRKIFLRVQISAVFLGKWVEVEVWRGNSIFEELFGDLGLIFPVPGNPSLKVPGRRGRDSADCD